MKLNNFVLEYIKGNKFSNGLSIFYDFFEPIPSRILFLKNYVTNKNIIHLGCLDHGPLIEEKIKQGKWLHKELTDSAHKCLGIDINQETQQFVKDKFGYDNIILGDFTDKGQLPEVTNEKWDYAILGELLEHIDNPVDFLSKIRANYIGCIEKIVITVPNAWAQTTMQHARKSIELINTDHRYLFTPYTLAKVVHCAGFEIEDFYFTNLVPLSFTQLIKRKILIFFAKNT